MKKRSQGADILLKSIVKGIFEKKGMNVLRIDLRKIDTRITDFFLICHGSSTTQVSAIYESIEDTARKETGQKPLHVEGLENSFWVLLDYGDVVVHVFLEEYRNFYNLESLWSDGDIEVMKDIIQVN